MAVGIVNGLRTETKEFLSARDRIGRNEETPFSWDGYHFANESLGDIVVSRGTCQKRVGCKYQPLYAQATLSHARTRKLRKC